LHGLLPGAAPPYFYALNRVYLVSAILFATLYPFIDFSALLNRHEQIARPIQGVIINWQAPVANIVQHDKWYYLALLFWTGVVVLAIRFIAQLVALYRLHKQSTPICLHQYLVRAISGDVNPFSFWKSIYINPDNHEPNELKAILAHEQIHVNQWHTVDIILGELSAIFYWFNPGVWLMKRAIRENIEFITDQKILQAGSDPKTYQYSLLNVSLQGGRSGIVNHFNTSTIKKRIMMMNSKRSSTINLTRYAFLVPAVIVLVLIFSVSKAELTKSVTNGNVVVAKAFKAAVNTVSSVTKTTAVVAAKRKLLELPKAMSAFINPDQEPVKLDTPKKSLNITTNNNEVVVTGYGPAKQNNNEVVVTGYGLAKQDVAGGAVLNKPQGIVGREGSITVNGVPIAAVQINGTTTYHNLTANDLPMFKGGIKTMNLMTADAAKTSRIRLRGLGVTSAEQPLIVVNGKVIPDDEVEQINQDDIESMAVFKGETGLKLYGDKAKNGAIVITLKKVAETKTPGLFADKLLLIDGIETTQSDVNKLPASKVKKMAMLDAGSSELKKFGDKAKNGAISITTK
jgi:hypothetical protein